MLSLTETTSGPVGSTYPFGQGNYFSRTAVLTDGGELTGGTPNYSGCDYLLQSVKAGKTGDAYTQFSTCYISEADANAAHAAYVGGVFQTIIGTTRGGTSGSKKGLCEGISAAVIGLAGSDYLAVQTAEFANSLACGVDCTAKTILTLGMMAGDAQQGTVIDTMLHFSDNVVGAVGYQHAMRIGADGNASPLTSTGTIFECFGNATIKSGFDLSAYSFTDYAFRSPNFHVTGSGVMQASGVIGTAIVAATTVFAATEIATPGTPDPGIVYIYAKSDHKLYSLGSDGIERAL